jgi:hypothetical protein
LLNEDISAQSTIYAESCIQTRVTFASQGHFLIPKVQPTSKTTVLSPTFVEHLPTLEFGPYPMAQSPFSNDGWKRPPTEIGDFLPDILEPWNIPALKHSIKPELSADVSKICREIDELSSMQEEQVLGILRDALVQHTFVSLKRIRRGPMHSMCRSRTIAASL